ncbi:2Fe-2S iron-sulfur cluster-binding protein [Arundinibacter roseus]|uniref:2Fe-2S iron-sulfur cluster binding domain-containing protein n=1 Tax=Arundinibacter roseus TaxID=2070510 RepID=A0A4R4KMB3_9BACT|nr:2Fe-2S iron-sulfur cluster-binding protein [Arundinibacter roseus]TDB68132.1 2Fe-2S iron-sulfur cluster binding domain-containing protein [Arundinibacter roseus]
MIQFIVEDRDGTRRPVEIPEGMGLNLMEVLKASEYNILATCGGMALCATCHVHILEGEDKLPPVSDAELDILDTLPSAHANSRLACQLRVEETIEGAVFQIAGEEN